MKTEYLPVAEHEDIVRQIQNKDLDSQRRMLEDVQANKEAQLEQIQNELKQQAYNEQMRLQEIIRSMEKQLQDVQLESQKLIEEKDKGWRDMIEVRATQAMNAEKTATERENELRKIIEESDIKMGQIQAEVSRLQAELDEKT